MHHAPSTSQPSRVDFSLLKTTLFSMRKPFIAEDYGDFISVSKENIVLKNRDKTESAPLKESSHVIVKGSFISFSSAFILKCLKNNIPIIRLDNLGRPYSVIDNLKRTSNSKELQVNFSKNNKSTNFVVRLLKEKIRKQHQVLHYHIRSLKLNNTNELKNIEGYNFKHFIDSFDVCTKKKISIRKI